MTKLISVWDDRIYSTQLFYRQQRIKFYDAQMKGYIIILKSMIIMLLIALVFVPVAGLGYCALGVSMYSSPSAEEKRELMCEECFKSVLFASEMLGCNKDILEQRGYYNDYK